MDPSSKPSQELRFTPVSIFNSVVRCLCWISFVLGTQFLLIPKFEKMFAEFGIELPAITQYAMAFSNRVIAAWFMVIPIVFAMAMGQEVLILLLARGPNRLILNIVAWTVLLLAIFIFGLAFALPLNSVIRGIAS